MSNYIYELLDIACVYPAKFCLKLYPHSPSCISQNSEVFLPIFCTEIKCPDLSAPANGAVTLDLTSVGAMANFSCNSGYFLVGEAILTCGGDGTWSAEPPQCIGKYIEPGIC